ncbi:hypothetical protein ACIRG5_47075 [Lentzea sp. NPDC102401]|uniref:hypothetical protein n=1 Tax=Lentzea sp. NPDC102401 TaxID=3364128 RepID=UPI003816F676
MRDQYPAMLIASHLWCCTFQELHETRQNCAPVIAQVVTAAGLFFEQLMLGSIDIVEGRVEVLDPLLPLRLPRHRHATDSELEWRRQVRLGREDELFLERRSYIQQSRLVHLRQWLPVFTTDSCDKVEQRLLKADKARYLRSGLLRQQVVVPASDWRLAPARALASVLKQTRTPGQPGAAVIQQWHVAMLALLKITRISEDVFDDLDPAALARMEHIVKGGLASWPAARQLIAETTAFMKANAFAH